MTSFRHIGDFVLHERAAALRSASLAGQTLRAVGDEIQVLLSGAEFEVFKLSGPKDSGPPPHAHPWREAYWALSGVTRVLIGDDEVSLEPGGFVSVPAGTLHTYCIASDTASFLVMTSGHRAGRFFADLDANVAPGPVDDHSLPTLIEVARRNGLSSPLFV